MAASSLGVPGARMAAVTEAYGPQQSVTSRPIEDGIKAGARPCRDGFGGGTKRILTPAAAATAAAAQSRR
jgi:hypothetical protein